MNAYTIQNLTYTYPKQRRPANRDINLEIAQGEIFGILGDNGAGKTTLVRQMVGLLTPERGQITLFGKAVGTDALHVTTRVGYMPQEARAVHNLLAGEALFYTARLRGLSRSDAACERDRLLELWQASNIRDKVSSRLSGGERRLMRLATAMAGRPPILILDEPTNDLAPQRRRLVWDVLGQMNREQGTTVLFITHDAIDRDATSAVPGALDMEQIEDFHLYSTLTPALGLLGLGVFARDAGPEAIVYVMTGNVVVGLLFGAMDAVHSHITFLRFDGAMDYFATLPIRKSLWIMAMTASFLLISLPSVLMTLVLGPLLLDVRLHPTPLLILIIPLCALSLSGIGALLGLVGSTRGQSLNLGFLLTLAMTALGPVIVPPDRLPGILRAVGIFVPSTYAASAFRQTLVGPVTPRLALDIAVLGAITIASLTLVNRKMVWRQA